MSEREMVSFAEIEQILFILDERGINRELIEIPLGTRDPGVIKPLPGGRIRVVVPASGDFEIWLASTAPAILAALGWSD